MTTRKTATPAKKTTPRRRATKNDPGRMVLELNARIGQLYAELEGCVRTRDEAGARIHAINQELGDTRVALDNALATHRGAAPTNPDTGDQAG
jgi:hypothetical protein